MPNRINLKKTFGDPNIIFAFTILTSLGFLLSIGFSKLFALIMIIFTISLAFWGQSLAKKHFTKEINMVDVMSARFSEGLMFVMFFKPWFFLFSFNCVLSMFNCKRNRNIVLPLRPVFLIYFLFIYF